MAKSTDYKEGKAFVKAVYFTSITLTTAMQMGAMQMGAMQMGNAVVYKDLRNQLAEFIKAKYEVNVGKLTRPRRSGLSVEMTFVRLRNSYQRARLQGNALELENVMACVRFAAQLMNRHYIIRPLQAA